MHGRGYICWPRALSCGSARAKDRRSFSQVSTPMRSSTLAGVPMSATIVAPHRSRPGSNTWPGFLRVNVTVQSAATAPSDSPVFPMTPLGTSTAITGNRRCGDGLERRHDLWPERAAEAGAKQRIDDELGALEDVGVQRFDCTGPARRMVLRLAAQALAAPEQANAHRPPGRRQDARRRRSRRRRCCPAHTAPRPAGRTNAASLRAPPRFRRCP